MYSVCTCYWIYIKLLDLHKVEQHMRFSSHLDGVMVLHLIGKVIGKGKMLDWTEPSAP